MKITVFSDLEDKFTILPKREAHSKELVPNHALLQPRTHSTPIVMTNARRPSLVSRGLGEAGKE